jgi:BMFP domain-containing protein YqiC
MTDFKTLLSDFSHLISSMSSVAGNMRYEVEENIQSVFHTLVLQAGFVQRDEFNVLSERFDNALELIENLKRKIELLELSNNTNSSEIKLSKNLIDTKD